MDPRTQSNQILRKSLKKEKNLNFKIATTMMIVFNISYFFGIHKQNKKQQHRHTQCPKNFVKIFLFIEFIKKKKIELSINRTEEKRTNECWDINQIKITKFRKKIESIKTFLFVWSVLWPPSWCFGCNIGHICVRVRENNRIRQEKIKLKNLDGKNLEFFSGPIGANEKK